MHASVKIMDIEVDMMTNDIFIQKMNEYLTDDHLDVIFFASTGMLDRATKDESYRQLIEQAELFLPGEEALLTTHHVDMLEAGGMVISCRSLGVMLENLKEQGRTLYIIAQNEEEIWKLEMYCTAMQPEIKVVGAYVYDEEMEDDAVVNEINSHTPDMILLNLPVGIQEQWIMDHAALLNAKLCIAVGGVSGLILSEQKEAPEWVKKLGLEGAYQRLVKEQTVQKDFKARIFRKKIVQYNNNQIDEALHDSTQEKDDNIF